MWCLLSSSSWQVGSLTFRQHTVCHAGDWRLHYSSSALEATLGAEFDLSSLKTSLIRVGHSGTGHHWPRLSRKRNFHRNNTVPTGAVWHQTEARAAACVRVGGIGNAALWQIVRYTRLDVSAVVSSQFYLRDSERSLRDLRVDSWTALRLHWRRAIKYPRPFKVSRQSTCFLHAWMQVAAYLCYWGWPGAVPMYSSPWGWCSTGSVSLCWGSALVEAL